MLQEQSLYYKEDKKKLNYYKLTIATPTHSNYDDTITADCKRMALRGSNIRAKMFYKMTKRSVQNTFQRHKIMI